MKEGNMKEGDMQEGNMKEGDMQEGDIQEDDILTQSRTISISFWDNICRTNCPTFMWYMCIWLRKLFVSIEILASVLHQATVVT
ncbi:hypothetical protein BgiBS90_032019 [Biomphalaria glabrata]|nr:hypothetical protein BgiBS90_032019 [Biomphalaria glabrata]